MNNEELTQGELFCEEYRDDIVKLMRYVPWLETVGAKDVAHEYGGEMGKSDIKFPVYDGTMMNLIRELQKSKFMDKNYPYAFTRRHIKTPEQETEFIKKAWLKDLDYLKGVLSKYTMEGMRKSYRWSEAVERRLFLDTLNKLYEILSFYTKDKGTIQ